MRLPVNDARLAFKSNLTPEEAGNYLIQAAYSLSNMAICSYSDFKIFCTAGVRPPIIAELEAQLDRLDSALALGSLLAH
jgi:hypothetical protein